MKLPSLLADALAEVIGTAEFAVPWQTVKTFRPIAKASELGAGASLAPRLSIVPRNAVVTRLARRTMLVEGFVDLSLQVQVRLGGDAAGQSENDDFDGVLTSAQQLLEHVLLNAQTLLEDELESHLESAEVTLVNAVETDTHRAATAVVACKYVSQLEIPSE